MLKRFAPFMTAFATLLLLAPAHAEPRRIVSLNPCLDTILVHVADREQIAALSHYARDPSASTIADIARDLPFTSDSAEEIIALKPDLILSAGHSSLATRKALERVGMHSELFTVPDTVAGSLAQVRRVAALTGHPERGEALIARIEAAIAAMQPPQGAPAYAALIFQPSGLAAGSGSLIDEMMTKAGLRNVAARYGIAQWGTVGLEQLLARPPQILLADGATGTKPAWADRILSNPVLRAETGVKRAEFPQTLLFCGGPVLIRTTEALTAARKLMEGAP